MIFHLPQWQGSGKGKNIAEGSQTIRNLLDVAVIDIPLSQNDVFGDFEVNNEEAIYQQLLHFKHALESNQPEVVKTIGGDCGLEIVPVGYLNARYPNLGVIWFDAHGDINTPKSSPSKNFHGMPLRTLMGEGPKTFDILMASNLQASQIHYVGLRDIDQAEQEFISEENIYAPLTLNIGHLVETLNEKNIAHLYIHFDVDSLDPHAYSQSYYQVNNGLTIAESLAVLSALQSEFEIVGCSLLESVATSKEELEPIQPIIKKLFYDDL